MMSSYLRKCAMVLALGSVFAVNATAGSLIIEEGDESLAVIHEPAATESPASAVPAADASTAVAPPAGLPAMMLSPPPPLPVQTLPAALAAPVDESWIVRELDSSIFNVLMAWTNKAGWTFRLEHWTIQSDYPVQGGAKFGDDFKTAVRDLLDTTRQTALPVQPCFYSNKVLRVVPRSELCDRALARSN